MMSCDTFTVPDFEVVAILIGIPKHMLLFILSFIQNYRHYQGLLSSLGAIVRVCPIFRKQFLSSFLFICFFGSKAYYRAHSRIIFFTILISSGYFSTLYSQLCIFVLNISRNFSISGLDLQYLSQFQINKRMQQRKEAKISQQVADTLEKHYASIIEFKKNEMKINFVLDLPETEQQEKEQLKEIKQKIQIALKQEQTALKDLEKEHDLYPLSQDLLTASDKNSLTKCFIKQDRKWKNAQILQVDVEEQTAKILRYGQTQPEDFPAFYLKVLKLPDASLFKQGVHCKAIYSQDGQFYPCVIEKMDEEGYHVRYKKYNVKEVVKLLRLRPMQNKNQKQQEVTFENLDEFKVPQNLKILPNDPENVKKSKKLKVKALKFAFKNAQLQEVNQQKKSKWQSFNNQAPKLGHFKTKYDMQVMKRQKP